MAEGKYDQPVRSHIYHLVSVLSHIDQMVKEEGRLFAKNGLTDEDRTRLADVEVALDHCGDLLQQRRALRKFAQDTTEPEPGTAEIAENYEQ